MDAVIFISIIDSHGYISNLSSKWMNKTDIMGIMQVKKTQLAVLSVIFVGMMMVFLVPSLIEEAQAITDAKVYGPALTFFDNVKSHISEGSFF